uniref:Uncharacterized protein n=1 Tax=Anguilla anguilla TaxID=7936 RepID=A0A0E9PC19_ANGAN
MLPPRLKFFTESPLSM